MYNELIHMHPELISKESYMYITNYFILHHEPIHMHHELIYV